MHDIEPYYKWRQYYIASEDKKSLFYGREYSEFTYTNKVYNYFIHPQWDTMGSLTLYVKLIYVDYEEGYVFLELIGEWNDCLNNDIMFLKRELVDILIHHGVNKFVLLCDNVLNFHGSDDSYYEEWWEDIKESGGWIAMVNTLEHVTKEMENIRLQYYVNVGHELEEINWRKANPLQAFQEIDRMLNIKTKQIGY